MSCDCVPVTVLFLIMLILGIWSIQEFSPSLAGGRRQKVTSFPFTVVNGRVFA